MYGGKTAVHTDWSLHVAEDTIRGTEQVYGTPGRVHPGRLAGSGWRRTHTPAGRPHHPCGINSQRTVMSSALRAAMAASSTVPSTSVTEYPMCSRVCSRWL